jgi:cytochrome c biogenesis factor
MKFKNDLDFPIIIDPSADPASGALVFNFYGPGRLGRTAEMEEPKVDQQVKAPPPIYEDDPTLAPGQSVSLGSHAFRFDGVERHAGPNYIADTGTVSVTHDGVALGVMHPEKRSYASGGQVMTEAAIAPGLTRDLYVALGEPLGGGSWAVRVHVKPFVRWIWLGAVLMALGGFVTATDRRFRRIDLLPKDRP